MEQETRIVDVHRERQERTCLNLPVVVNEMRSKHYNFQFKVIGVGFESKHDGGELGIVCPVTRGHTHSQLLLALDKINTEIDKRFLQRVLKHIIIHACISYNRCVSTYRR